MLHPPQQDPAGTASHASQRGQVANQNNLSSPLNAKTPPLPAPQPIPAQQLAPPPPGLAGGSRPTPPPIQITPLPNRRREQASDAPRARIASNLPTAASAAAAANAGNGPAQGGNWRQGKPIFDWISRKLGGARRGSDAGNERPAAHEPQHQRAATGGGHSHAYDTHNRSSVRSKRLGYQRAGRRAQLSPIDTHLSRNSVDSPYRTESLSVRSYSASNTPSERRREANNPYPSLPIPLVRRSYPASTLDSGSRAPSISVFTRSRTPSLASLSSLAARRPRISIADENGSTASDSFKLSGRMADEDASVRPIPPSPTNVSFVSRSGSAPLNRSDSQQRSQATTPPPMSERRDTMSSSYGASYMSEGSRQASIASTKPTTLMSFDGAAPAHIAVASPSQAATPPGITRSTSSPTGTTSLSPDAASPVSPSFPQNNETRVPVHSRYHPRNNPNPSAVPRPDASIITLASSTFATAPSPIDRSADRPWDRIHPASLRIRDSASPSAYHPPSASPTVAFADRPGSIHDGLSATMSLSVRTRDKYARADEDASVRALRRRGSWESGESRWSWRPAVGEPAGVFLNRRSELFSDDEVNSPAPLRGSVYRERDYRQVLNTWAAENDEGSESGLHRPVSVTVSVV